MAAELVHRGAEVRVRAEALAIDRREASVVVRSTGGDVQGRAIVACAGLGSDRVARMAGLEPGVRIIPFRGEYWMLALERAHLVKSLIYPVPDPAFPFLGVHFTRRIGGGIEAGPNAVLAMAREGYSRASFDPRDALDVATWPGFWRMAGKHWRAGLGEQWRSLSRRAFAAACAALVPEVREEDLAPGGAGVRAQAIGRDGELVDDFDRRRRADGARRECALAGGHGVVGDRRGDRGTGAAVAVERRGRGRPIGLYMPGIGMISMSSMEPSGIMKCGWPFSDSARASFDSA
jgi:(S)-2-hydroxyglutarate dehydrogenase